MNKNQPALCNNCGLCNHVCPVFRAYRGREMFGPRFKMQLLKKGQLDKVLFLWTGGDVLERACPNGVDMDFLSLRRELYDEGLVPASLKKLVMNTVDHRDPYHDDAE